MTSKESEKFDIKENYGHDCILSKEEFISKHNININGLSDEGSIQNIYQYGKNEIKQSKPKRWYNYFFASLLSPFNIILLGISFILCYTDVILPAVPNYTNIFVIIILVLVSTLLEFTQEFKSNKAAEKLKELVATTTTVLRNNKKVKIFVNNLTINDIVILSAGDMVSADLRIIESESLYIGQSSITGESDAVRKVTDTEISSIDKIESISDLDTICLMGTNVISGSATAVVIKIGDSTYFGKVAQALIKGKPKTNFRLGIESISRLLIRFMLVMIPITFAVNISKHDLLTTFTFAVAIAIGITPLLLPVILSSTLSKGAIRMSKKKTIVKKLDSIQSFGAMNILCTDKTGTLTEDKIVLEKYLDIHGTENIGILKYAFLNSYFQTGLKGSIDEAIINRALKNDLGHLIEKYRKIDEIPFDFTRRRLSVVVDDDDDDKERLLITKGAVEEILNICSFVEFDGSISDISEAIKTNVKSISEELNKQGMRVIAVCKKTDIYGIGNFEVKDESDMILLGFIGFLDPPKESAKASIDNLNNAGIRVIILTGDNPSVTKAICSKVGINTSRIVTGNEIDNLPDSQIIHLLKDVNVFAKLSPMQKVKIVTLLKQSGNVVGYMGDGINDAPSLTNSDVGISVDTAVDIAKETADIILLEKDLNVLMDGVLEGRATYTNLMKYIKVATSMNFGEVFSVLIASILLPFFPITPIQLLVQSLLYDMGQLSIPFDNVDKDELKKPKKWSIKSIRNFMLYMGPISSCFDLVVFATLWFGFKLRADDSALFQTIWFTYGIVSNLIGLHILRTAKTPFFKSNASRPVYFTTILFSIIAILIPFTFIGKAIGLVAIPLKYLGIIFVVPLLYCIVALFAKKAYVKKFNEWI
ncbi:MAG: magnesium-translocating P-type ATPase [Clostridia bacterium]|nr:magnesium-translocating P-type ATPase [Clostridia bacterium]MDD4387426.1 magnesium-translocating P-type ATPase [Clostridia bacterium]